MEPSLKLSRAIDKLNTWVGKAMIWLIFAATAISAVNAVVRKLFNFSSNAYLEVQWYLFAWAFLCAAGYTLFTNEHVRIDVVNEHLPKRLRVWIEIVGLTLFLTPLCLLVLYLGIPMLVSKFQSGEMSNNPGGLIRWPVWAAIPVGFTLLLLQGWSQLIKCIAWLRGWPGDPLAKHHGEKSDEQELIDALLHDTDRPGAAPAAAGPQQP